VAVGVLGHVRVPPNTTSDVDLRESSLATRQRGSETISFAGAP
jgi:hypothetical protein